MSATLVNLTFSEISGIFENKLLLCSETLENIGILINYFFVPCDIFTSNKKKPSILAGLIHSFISALYL